MSKITRSRNTAWSAWSDLPPDNGAPEVKPLIQEYDRLAALKDGGQALDAWLDGLSKEESRAPRGIGQPQL